MLCHQIMPPVGTAARSLLLALSALAVARPVSVAAQVRRVVADSVNVLTASGSGEVALSPDRAILRLEVQSRAATAAEAAAANSDRVRRVVDSLNALRLPAETVQVVGVGVRPRENFERAELVGYDAVAYVRVVVANLERLAVLIDAALRTGATSLDDVDWQSDRAEAARNQALERAYAAARRDAEALAAAAGRSLGPLLRLSTEPEPGLSYYYEARAFNITAASVGIAPRDVTVQAHVLATWRLGPRRR